MPTRSTILLLAALSQLAHGFADLAFKDSPGWKPLQKQLDALPVFTVANEQGSPLQYEVDGKQCALFYADVEAAKKELANAQAQYPDLGCDLIPVGLGNVFLLTCEGKATLIPGVTELTAAGMPAGVPAIGQPLPLFACMEMSREGPNGDPVLPLFMSFDDCNAAVKQATADDDDGGPPLEVVGLSLPSVVEKLSGVGDQAFSFVPPTASSAYIEAYLNTQQIPAPE